MSSMAASNVINPLDYAWHLADLSVPKFLESETLCAQHYVGKDQ